VQRETLRTVERVPYFPEKSGDRITNTSPENLITSTHLITTYLRGTILFNSLRSLLVAFAAMHPHN
jgi:hypothetical protein